MSAQIDIEQWVRDWAQQSDSSVHIDWRQVSIIPAKPEYYGSLENGNGGTSEIVAEYENNTGNQQTYQLSAKRTTHSEWSVDLTTGFSRGLDYDVSMETPADVSQYGFPSVVTLKTNKTPHFDEAMTIDLNTPVKVSSGMKATVSVVTSDKVYQGKFTQDIRVRGKVTVNLYKDTIFSGRKEININELARLQRNLSGRVTTHGSGNDGITVHVKGTCRFRFVSNQKVTVDEEEMY